MASAATSLLTCMPLLSALGAVLGVFAWRRAAASGRRSRLAMVSLLLAGIAFAVQVAAWHAADQWLLPALQRRTTTALMAACEGRQAVAVPESGSPTLAAGQPAPSEAEVLDFAQAVRDALGGVKSISVINPEVSGSALSPTVTMALVAQFERDACTGSARVQWVPPAATDPQPWLPVARVLEMELTLPDRRVLRLAPEPVAASSP